LYGLAEPASGITSLSSIDRVLAILNLFEPEHSVLTAEEIAKAFDISVSQAYRYCKSLVVAGFLDPWLPEGYVLGPAFIEFAYKIQKFDPLINAARPVMIGLSPHVPAGTTILLGKLYRSRVMCVDQIQTQGPQIAISFEKGRARPLLWGATPKVILAHLSSRDLLRVYNAERLEQQPHRGKKLPLADLKKELSQIRRDGFCVAHAEVDPGRVGVASPVFFNGSITGSLGVAMYERETEPRQIRRIASLLVASAKEVEENMREVPSNDSRRRRVTAAPTHRRIHDMPPAS
jgi:DNA-binding IclR family transcriptional regulator